VNVSVIVCTYNRCKVLERTLKTVAEQDVPAALSWEALVVDNRSTDDTAEVVRRFAEPHPVIRYVREETQGLSHARNRGIREAEAELLCFVDDDVLLRPDYVASAYRAWQTGSWDIAGGRVLAQYEVVRPAWVDRLPARMLNGPFGLHDHGEADQVTDPGGELVPVGASMLIPRATIEKLGEFNPELGRSGRNLRGGEDVDFYRRAQRAGMRMGYCGSCTLRHLVLADRLRRRYLLRWKYVSSVVGSNEVLPAGTRYWLRVPWFQWRRFAESALALVGALVCGRRFLRLLEFVSELGAVIGYLTGRRTDTVDSTEHTGTPTS